MVIFVCKHENPPLTQLETNKSYRPIMDGYFHLVYAPPLDMGYMSFDVADAPPPGWTDHTGFAVASWAQSNVVRLTINHTNNSLFLSRLYVRAVLIFSLKQNSAWNIFKQSNIFWLRRSDVPQLYRQGPWGPMYIIYDLLNLVSGERPTFLTSGIYFLEYVRNQSGILPADY